MVGEFYFGMIVSLVIGLSKTNHGLVLLWTFVCGGLEILLLIIWKEVGKRISTRVEG